MTDYNFEKEIKAASQKDLVRLARAMLDPKNAEKTKKAGRILGTKYPHETFGEVADFQDEGVDLAIDDIKRGNAQAKLEANMKSKWPTKKP